MTQIILPTLLGLGLSLILWSIVTPSLVVATRRSHLADLLSEAGIGHISPTRLVLACCALAGVAALVVYAVSDSVAVAVALGGVVAPLPVAWVRHLQRRRQAELRQVWPDAIEHLASGIRAGLALPEAIGQLSDSGPEELRPAFAAFEGAYRSSGRFSESLDVLKRALADPVGDRVIEALRLAREVGGSDLGRLLRTLATFLRDDARVRGELESRQSWTVNAACS